MFIISIATFTFARSVHERVGILNAKAKKLVDSKKLFGYLLNEFKLKKS